MNFWNSGKYLIPGEFLVEWVFEKLYSDYYKEMKFFSAEFGDKLIMFDFYFK
jgi:hypothetical protein